jgi:hypothetical protein
MRLVGCKAVGRKKGVVVPFGMYAVFYFIH